MFGTENFQQAGHHNNVVSTHKHLTSSHCMQVSRLWAFHTGVLHFQQHPWLCVFCFLDTTGTSFSSAGPVCFCPVARLQQFLSLHNFPRLHWCRLVMLGVFTGASLQFTPINLHSWFASIDNQPTCHSILKAWVVSSIFADLLFNPLWFSLAPKTFRITCKLLDSCCMLRTHCLFVLQIDLCSCRKTMNFGMKFRLQLIKNKSRMLQKVGRLSW